LQEGPSDESARRLHLAAVGAHASYRFFEFLFDDRDHGEETLAEIGRSYNVSGWTVSRLANPENAPLGANIAQGVDILWD
jgi:hypothetical protein